MKKKRSAIALALLAAALYAGNVPLSKLLLTRVAPTMLAGFLYLGAGAGSIAVALLSREVFPALPELLAMLLGFLSYGLSIDFYIMAQKHLGAAKTSAFYSAAPFWAWASAF